jgi:hypothetical protein
MCESKGDEKTGCCLMATTAGSKLAEEVEDDEED